MKETLTPIAKRCYSDHNDGAHGDPRPTGCEYGFRKRLRCKKCPHWSESRFWISAGEIYAEGLRAGIEAGQKERIKVESIKAATEHYLKEAKQ